MDFIFLEDAIVLEVEGKDAQRYLNSRLTNDIKNMPVGEKRSAGCLSPQGKTEALFQIFRKGETDYLLVCDGGSKETVIAAFRRYIVADRVNVKDISADCKLLVVYGETYPDGLNELTVYNNQPKRSKSASYDFLIKNQDIEVAKTILINNNINEISLEEMNLRRIKAGIPSFPAEINEKIIFTASGLNQSISFGKGCYVGQEVIEKTEAFGKVPYVLKAYSTTAEVSTGKALTLKDNPQISAGKVISFCFDPKENKSFLFAEIKNKTEILDSVLAIDNTIVQPLC